MVVGRAVVEIVRVEDAGLLPSKLTVLGEKLQAAPAGRPEQAKEIPALKTGCGVIVTEYLAGSPAAGMETLLGLTLTEKSDI